MATSNLLMGLTAWGVFTLVLGLLVVFLGMTIIILFVTLAGRIVSKKEKKNAAANPDDEEEEVTITLPSAPAETAREDEIPDEIKAAIVAAIAAYYDGEKAKPEFVVRKIKKI